jgi:hypothetical protein
MFASSWSEERKPWRPRKGMMGTEQGREVRRVCRGGRDWETEDYGEGRGKTDRSKEL